MKQYLKILNQISNSSTTERLMKEKAFQELINAYPKKKEAYVAYALQLVLHEDRDKAIDILDKAIARCNVDNDFNIFYYRARLASEVLDFRNSIKFYKKSLKIIPNHRQANFGLAVALLTSGNIAEGSALYHFRDYPEETKIFRKIRKWNGEDISNKVLIWAEQGLGDELMFLRFLPWLEKFKCQFTIQCDPRILQIFASNYPWAQFIPRNQSIQNLDSFDKQIPMGNLFALFHPMIDQPIIRDHFLKPLVKPHLIDQLMSNKKNIGISWLSANAEKGILRSIPIEIILKCLSSKKHRLINLQYLAPGSEIEKIKNLGFEVMDKVDCFQNIEELAYIITKCEQVISIDNSTLHLAGALGIKAIGLLPREVNWRWLQDSENSYWYPSLQLIRQSTPGDWLEPIERLSTIIL